MTNEELDKGNELKRAIKQIDEGLFTLGRHEGNMRMAVTSCGSYYPLHVILEHEHQYCVKFLRSCLEARKAELEGRFAAIGREG